MTSDKLKSAIQAAWLADEMYSDAVKAAGFKSRWDVPGLVMKINPQLQSAYDDKVEADRRMHEAYKAERALSDDAF